MRPLLSTLLATIGLLGPGASGAPDEDAPPLRTRSVSGQVIDPFTHEGIEGAEVIALAYPYPPEIVPLASTTTAADGHFHFPALPRNPSSKVGFVAHKKGYVSSYGRLASSTAEEPVLSLLRGHRVRGRVRFADGRPVSSGRVFLHSSFIAAARQTPQGGRYLVDHSKRFVEIGEEGRFELMIPGGLVALEVSGEDFAPAFSEVLRWDRGPVGPVEIVVERGQTASGIVQDPEGRPIAGATVLILPAIAPRDPDRVFLGHTVWRSARSDEHGRYAVTGLGEHVASIVTRHRSSETFRDYDDVATAGERRITLQPAQCVAGRLRVRRSSAASDGDSRTSLPPVGRFTLQNGDQHHWVDVDEDGHFVSEPLDRTRRSGFLLIDGFRRLPLAWTAGPGENDLGDLELVPGDELRVTVVDQRGRPRPGARVRLGTRAAFHNHFVPADQAWTDAGGEAHLIGVDGDSIAVEVDLRGYAPWRLEQNVTEGLEVVATLSPDANLRGTVTDGSGKPIEGAVVQVWAGAGEGGRGRRYSPARRTDETGAYFLDGVAVGCPLSLTVRAAGHERRRVEMPAIDEARVLDLDAVTLAPAPEVLGTVRDEHGAPVEGALVTATWVDTGNIHDTAIRFSPWAETDENGAFRIGSIEAGSYRIGATLNGRSSELQSIVVDAATRIVELTVTEVVARSLDGRVLDVEGRPVSGATLELRAGSEWIHGRSDHRGAFTLHGVPADANSMSLRVQHQEYLGAHPTGLSPEDFPLEFKLRPAATLLLDLQVLGDRPLPTSFYVQLRDSRRSWSRHATREGHLLRLAGAPAGTRDLILEAPGFVPIEIEGLELANGDTTSAKVELDGSADPIVIRVVAPDGTPVPKAAVTFEFSTNTQHSSRLSYGNGFCDHRGRFHSPLPRSPRLEMTVSAPGFAEQKLDQLPEKIAEGALTVRLRR